MEHSTLVEGSAGFCESISSPFSLVLTAVAWAHTDNAGVINYELMFLGKTISNI